MLHFVKDWGHIDVVFLSFNKCIAILGIFASCLDFVSMYCINYVVWYHLMMLLALASPFDDSFFEILCRTVILVSFC